MAALEILPDGIIIDLLTCGVLSHTDVINFGFTCKRFLGLANSNSAWKGLFLLKWPSFLFETSSVRKKFVKKLKDGILHWRSLYNQVNKIFEQLDTIHHSYFHEEQIDDKVFDVFLDYCNQFSFEFVHAVLHDIITDTTSISLTDKYYAKKVFHYILRHSLVPQFKNLTMVDHQNDENELSKLIRGAALIEQWFNVLDYYAEGSIKNFVREASEKTAQYFDHLRTIEPTDDSAKIEHLKYVALNHVFFEELKFDGNQDYFNVDNSFIHKVIESRRGIPILLSIIYLEIARKLDFNLECVNNPGHFILRWKVEELDSEHPTVSEIARAYRFIDVFNGGRILQHSNLPSAAMRANPASITEVLHRVSLNVDAHSRISLASTYDVQLSLNALNLCLLLEPKNYRDLAKRMKLSLNHNINFEVALADNLIIPEDIRPYLSLRSAEDTEKIIRDRMKKRERQRQNYKPTIYLRSDEENHDVNYSVGMVMKHRRYDYVCVIRGWDPQCQMPQIWVEQMGVNMLERGTEQPFYHVLVDKDGSERYAAEDNLEMIEHKEELDHREIGRYFSATRALPVRHYVPNSEVELRYPDDESFTQMNIDETFVDCNE